jgi:rhodanese-related sulfurtransferase
VGKEDFNWWSRDSWPMIDSMKLNPCLIPCVLLVAGCGTPDAPEGGTPTAETSEAPAPVPVVETKEEKPAVKPGTVGSIEVTGLFGLVESGEVLLYDVRPPFIQSLGRIAGSTSMPRKKFAEMIGGEEARMKEANAAGRSVVLYCANLKCPDAEAVAEELAKRGISSKVYHAGWEEWKEAGLPTE